MNRKVDFSNILKNNKDDLDWMAIHDYPTLGSQTSKLYGDTWSDLKPWKLIAETIYQPLSLNVFKFVLFNNLFNNGFPVIVKLLPSDKLQLVIRKKEKYTLVKICIIDYNKDQLQSLYNLWTKIETKINFTKSDFCKLLSFLGSNCPENNFEEIREIIEAIKIPAVTIDSEIKISSQVKNNLKYLFIGTLLWPWKSIVYELLQSAEETIRYGIVISTRIQPEKFITTPLFYDIYINGLMNIWESELYEKRRNATRAAISQVMARNMSHNIGSHVLSKLGSESLVRQIYFKNKETAKNTLAAQNNSTRFDDWDFYQCINKLEKIDWKDKNSNIYTPKETKSPNDALIAVLFDYLRKRMDYLADVTTSTPVIENSKFFFNDIVSPFIQNRALNDRISGISKFEYEIILCKPINHLDHCRNQKTASDCRMHTNNFIVDNKNDFQVSIPNDVVGNHAFYTILENIIRNTAKHAQKPKGRQVEFKIKVQNANELYKDSQAKLPDINLNEYYSVSIFDNCKFKQQKLTDLINNQNTFLNESVLDKDTNQLRQSHWGLIEMDASAAYLRKISIEQIDSDDYNITDLTGASPLSEGKKLCILQAYPEQNKYLGYRFFIRKPHEVLIIQKEDEITSDISEPLKYDLEKKGVWIKKQSEIENYISQKKAFPHRLVVLTPKVIDIVHKIEDNALFSKRILKVKENIQINYSDSDGICEKLWKEYYNIEENKPNYVLYENATYSNHGDNYCESLSGTNGNSEDIGNEFVEISFSATNHFFKKDLKFVNSWSVKIAVIDERIQSISKERYNIQSNPSCSPKGECFHSKGVPFAELYKHTNIILPPDDIDLNHQSFDPILNKMKKFIRKCTHKIPAEDPFGNGVAKKPCEFIVIHLGVIEKLILAHNRKGKRSKKTQIEYNKEKQEQVGDFIKHELLGLSASMCQSDRNVYDKIIITSGRGTPHNLPEDLRYLNYSAVSQYLTTQRNKYAFTEVLHSARKISKT